MARRKLEYIAVEELVPAARNSKAHDDALIGASVSRFGYIEPIVLDERTGTIVSGHGRRDELLRGQHASEPPPDGIVVKDGRWLAPVQRGWSSKDDAEALAAGIALNQSTIAGGWRLDELAPALQELELSDAGLEGLGFAHADIDTILATLELARTPDEPAAEIAVGAVPANPITQPGDLWTLGEHRLICGDCRDPEVVARLLDGAQINVAFTSPPYAEQREYDEASGFKPIPPDEYVEWFRPVAENVAAHLASDGSWFVNIKPPGHDLDTDLYVLDLVIAHVRAWRWHFATEFCWERSGVPARVVRRFKNQFEPIYQFALGEWKVRPDNVRHATPSAIMALGPGGSIGRDASLAGSQGGTGNGFLPQAKARKNAYTGPMVDRQGGPDQNRGEAIGVGWAYPGNLLPTFTGSHEATGHSAAFPVGLPAWFTRGFADEGDTLYDPFVGSGSTLLAAAQEGRVGYGVEISPGYCDVALRRFQAHTGVKPQRAGDREATDFSG